ncbi:ABC transporter ATP-binding protein [Paenibacillus glucanolyticus]|uniref:ABC transporter ATP-binding protein n=1 Tax=Paenibacillus glucanolyticus TaxID=59843 RepID=UPI0036AC544D
MSETFVQMTDVGKTIKGQIIVNQLNLKIPRGQVVALLGGNGAGKSTILRMLAGIIQPTRGDIRVGDWSWKENRRGYAELIGYMPDDYRFSPGLTARETMAFWAKLKGLTAKHGDDMLAQVGLEYTEKKTVSSFSKGMRQRVLFAQVLLGQSPLIIMDEPTNGMDPYWMQSFVEMVREAAYRGQTVLFSTHQLHIAEALADRILFLKEGAIRFEGSGEDIRQQLGSSGMEKAFDYLFGIADAPR